MEEAAVEEDVTALTVEILSGRWDGWLMHIAKATGQRLMTGPNARRWRLDYIGDDLELSITEEDLTVGEAAKIEKLTGQPWVKIDPITSAQCAGAVLATCLHTRAAMSAKAAADLVDALGAAALTRMLDYYEVGDAPLG